MRAGFIGLGSMGQPMAGSLLRAGHKVIAYNRTRERAEGLRSYGATVASTAAEACAGEVVFTMLADDTAVGEVVFGDRGILSELNCGLHVSLSTISVGLAKRLAQAHSEKGQQYVSAPVFGRPEAAAAAKLVIVASGSAASVAGCRPLLEAMSQKVFVASEEAWKANAIKLAGNFMLASMLETLSEAVALMRKSEIDPKLFLEIVNGNLFRSPVYENYGGIIAEQKFEPAGFKMRLGLKDVRLVLAAAMPATSRCRWRVCCTIIS